MLRIDDDTDERQAELCKELDARNSERTRSWVLVVAPPRGTSIKAYYHPESTSPPRQLTSKHTDYGYVITDSGTESWEDIRSSKYAFTGSYPKTPPEADVLSDEGRVRLPYIEYRPASVPTFTCDWCEELKRGERSSRRYKPDEMQTDGYPKEMWTLCRDCDPHYDEDGEHVAEVDHPRLGGVS